MELLPFIQEHLLYFGAAALLIGLIIANEINLLRYKRFAIDVTHTLSKANDEVAIIIDLRTQDDYKKGHIPTAVNIPYQNIEEKLTDLTNYAGKQLIVYAADDARANQTCLKVQKLHSTTKVYAMTGGINAWVAANLPLAKGKK